MFATGNSALLFSERVTSSAGQDRIRAQKRNRREGKQARKFYRNCTWILEAAVQQGELRINAVLERKEITQTDLDGRLRR